MRPKQRNRIPLVDDIYLTLCESVDSSWSLRCAILYRARQWEDLFIPPEAHNYELAENYRNDYQCSAYLKRFPWLPGGRSEAERTSAALIKFLEAEELCRDTNRRFRAAMIRGFSNPRVDSALMLASKKIYAVLGDFDWDKVLPLMKWGPGSTTAINGKAVHAADKFACENVQTTERCCSLALALLSTSPSWGESALNADGPCSLLARGLTIASGNKLDTVPKDAFINRIIAIEPHLNSFIQLGIGRLMTNRIRMRTPIDLHDQTLNQRLARQGSITGHLATVDLSSASDTISSELVKALLPIEWWSAMDLCRSHYTTMPDGSQLRLEKWSSMGNGFNFPLQTVIFYSLANACCELSGSPQISIAYGDDIIIPSSAYDLFSEVAHEVGFIINGKKSFSSGPFRESCGKDYFRGIDVRPIFLKEWPIGDRALYRIINAISRWSSDGFIRHGPFRQVYFDLLKHVRIRFKIPNGYGDGGIACDFDDARPKRAPYGHEGWVYKHTVDIPLTKRRSRGVFPYALYSAGTLSISQGDELPLRKATREKKLCSIASKWHNLGRWVS